MQNHGEINHPPLSNPSIQCHSLISQAQAVTFYTVCLVGESSVIGQHHRPTQQPEALRRAALSAALMFGRDPEKEPPLALR